MNINKQNAQQLIEKWIREADPQAVGFIYEKCVERLEKEGLLEEEDTDDA